MLVRRLLLREGRRGSRCLRLRVCRGCSVGCIGGRQAWGISVPYVVCSQPAPSLLLSCPSFPSLTNRTSIIIKHLDNEDLKHMIRQTNSGIHPPMTRILSALFLSCSSIYTIHACISPSLHLFYSFFLTRPPFLNTHRPHWHFSSVTTPHYI